MLLLLVYSPMLLDVRLGLMCPTTVMHIGHQINFYPALFALIQIFMCH